MNQLLLAFVLTFSALSADTSATPEATTKTQEVNLYVVRALYSMIDFDGGTTSM